MPKAVVQVAWYSNLDGGVDEITFCKCLSTGKMSRGCFGFTHGSVGAALQLLNAAKCCANDHRLCGPHTLLMRAPERSVLRPNLVRVRVRVNEARSPPTY